MTRCSTAVQSGRNRAFTFIDLLAVMVIVCLMAGIVFSSGAIWRAREQARQIRCMSNLKQAGMALMLYANENKGLFPRVRWEMKQGTTQYTGVEAKNPFDPEKGPGANDVTAAMFLLLRTQDLPVDVFICPSTDRVKFDFGGKTAQDCSNFPAEENLSYSFANPYPDQKVIMQGYKWNNVLPADFVVAADMNPGKAAGADVTAPKNEKASQVDMRKANSLNHRQLGQNALFADGHIEWMQTPFCGSRKDNIYTVAASESATTGDTITGSPAWAFDSVLLPVATSDPHKKTEAREEAEAFEVLRKELPRMKAELARAEKEGMPPAELARAKKDVAALEEELNKAGSATNGLSLSPGTAAPVRQPSNTLWTMMIIGSAVLLVGAILIAAKLKRPGKV